MPNKEITMNVVSAEYKNSAFKNEHTRKVRLDAREEYKDNSLKACLARLSLWDYQGLMNNGVYLGAREFPDRCGRYLVVERGNECVILGKLRRGGDDLFRNALYDILIGSPIVESKSRCATCAHHDRDRGEFPCSECDNARNMYIEKED